MSKLTLLPLLLLAVGCTSSDPPRRTSEQVHQIARACAIEVEVAAAAMAGEIDPIDPGDGGGDGGGGGSLPIACCTDPDGCTPMDYPDDVCQELPTPVEATDMALNSLVPYSGGTTTAFFGNCEPPPGDPCPADTTAYVFEPYPSTRWMAAFVPDGYGGEIAEVYEVPAGATKVKIPSGAQIFPLLEETDGFADLSRPVLTPDGIKYVDKQNDCIPRPDGCGFTCYTC
jgi:hypothetical protein